MTDEFIGKTIGGYAIEAPIGRGGMATVYLARQTSMNRTVALKILPRDQMKDEAYYKRFEREVSIVAQLEHRSIVPVYDHGEHEGQPFIALRYMSGGSLDAPLQNGPLPLARVLMIYQQIAPALDYAHAKGVLHRDLKPSNVLLDDAGGAYITDFGIARVFGENTTTQVTLTQHGVVGTPAYMSPEQAQGQSLDGRSDVYSLGVMLFELVTGRRPFHAETPYSIAVMQVTAEPPNPRQFNPTLSLSLEQVILKSLRKRPDDRFQTAVELTEALKMAIENPSGFNPHETQPNRRPRSADTQPVSVPAAALATPAPQPRTATPPTPVSAMRGVRVPTKPPKTKRETGGVWMSMTVGALMGCVLLTAIGLGAIWIGGGLLAPDPTSTASPTAEQFASPDMTETPVAGALQTEIASNGRNRDNLATLEALRRDGATLAPVEADGVISGRLIYAAPIISGDGITQHLFTRPITGDTSEQLTIGQMINSSPVVSPDGLLMAFISDRDGDNDLYIMDVNGGEARRVLETAIDEHTPVWSLDGQRLFFASDIYGDGSLVILEASTDGTGTVWVIYEQAGMRAFRPQLSPDGETLAFVLGRPDDAITWEIVMMSLRTRELTALTDNTVMDNWPVFSGDGRWLYAVRTEGESAEIWRIPVDGETEAYPIYSTTAWVSNLTLSPDGGALLFSEGPIDSPSGQLLVLPISGGLPRTLGIIAGLSADWIP